MSGSADGSAPLRLGISSCLLGDRVRWDGDHDRHSFLADVLAPHVSWVRGCPELEIGLGVPREPIALVKEGASHVLVAATSRRDLTEAMTSFATSRVEDFEELDGYVLKSRSPSCGLSAARVYPDRDSLFADGAFERSGQGLYATALIRRWPLLPVVEEVQLEKESQQTHFVERCFALRRARRALASSAEPTPAAVQEFLERHELQILCRSADARTSLARAALEAKPGAAASRVLELFAAAMAEPPQPERIAGVLRRVLNRLRSRGGPADVERWEHAVSGCIAGRASEFDVRADLLAAAVALGDEILARQTFLAPEPAEVAVIRAIASERENVE